MCLLESRSAVSALSGHGSFEKTWTLSSLGRQMIVICILHRILTESDKLRTKKRISTGSQQKAVLDDPGSLDARPLSSIGDSVSKSVNTGPSDNRLGRARSLFLKAFAIALCSPGKKRRTRGSNPQPIAGQLISNQPASHSLILPNREFRDLLPFYELHFHWWGKKHVNNMLRGEFFVLTPCFASHQLTWFPSRVPMAKCRIERNVNLV